MKVVVISLGPTRTILEIVKLPAGKTGLDVYERYVECMNKDDQEGMQEHGHYNVHEVLSLTDAVLGLRAREAKI